MMKIGIDLDNTITASEESTKFFKVFTSIFKHVAAEIHIITNREPGTEKEIEEELADLDIRWDYIKITAEKAEYIMKEGITVYFDDVDEYFLTLPENVCVFKIREEGNFDFDSSRWIANETTTKMI